MRKLLFGLLFCGCASAQATITDLGTLHVGEVISLTESNLVGDFNNSYTFSAAANVRDVMVQWVTQRVFPFYPVSHDHYTQLNVGNLPLDVSGQTELAFSGHAGGLNFTGGAGQFLPGSYYLEVTAVPEADTWLILLMGCGFLAWHMRHKHG